jgi:ribosome maturation factor RimP
MVDGSIKERIEKIAARAAEANKVEFLHAEIAGSKRNSTVRIVIDKEKGVTLDDCAYVSNAMEAELDADDFIPGKYVLEVSSPGLERQLYSLKDFVRFTGQLAKVKTAEAIDGAANFIGRIKEIDGEEIVFEDRSAGMVRIPYASVEKANLKVDLQEELKKKR